MKILFLTTIITIFLAGIFLYLKTDSLKKELNLQKSALLVIDIQNDYFPGGKMTLEDADNASLKAKKILEYYRKNKLEIIHIQHIASESSKGFFISGTEGVKIHNNVLPIKNEKIITKNVPSSFVATDLQDYLEKNNIKKLIITGMQTNVCVTATSKDALVLGFEPIIIGDTTAAVSNKIKKDTLKSLSKKIKILNTNDIID